MAMAIEMYYQHFRNRPPHLLFESPSYRIAPLGGPTMALDAHGWEVVPRILPTRDEVESRGLLLCTTKGFSTAAASGHAAIYPKVRGPTTRRRQRAPPPASAHRH